jgi:hypothetical protein
MSVPGMLHAYILPTPKIEELDKIRIREHGNGNGEGYGKFPCSAQLWSSRDWGRAVVDVS